MGLLSQSSFARFLYLRFSLFESVLSRSEYTNNASLQFRQFTFFAELFGDDNLQ